MLSANAVARLARPQRGDALAPSRIASGHVRDALREGWKDFAGRPSWTAPLGVINPAAALAMVWIVCGADVIEMLFPLLTGFALVGLIRCLGRLEISRRRTAGEAARRGVGRAGR